jgi:cation transport regulator
MHHRQGLSVPVTLTATVSSVWLNTMRAFAARRRADMDFGLGTCRALGPVMPYATNAQLPERLQECLPRHAQDIFRAAFNAAYERYGPSHEERACRIAWGAVKRNYVQRSARIWVRRPAKD